MATNTASRVAPLRRRTLASVIWLAGLCAPSCHETQEPYAVYELEVRNAFCECFELDLFHSENHYDRYFECATIVEIALRDRLDAFPEDARLSKAEYRKRIPLMLSEMTTGAECGMGSL